MNIPTYIEKQAAVIAIDGQTIKNQSPATYDQEILRFHEDGEYYLYINNIDNEMKIVVEENTHVTLFLMAYNSRKTTMNMSVQLKQDSLLKCFSQFLSRRRTILDVNRQFDLDKKASLILLNNLTYRGIIHLNDDIYLNDEQANLDIDLLNINAKDDESYVKQHVYHRAKRTYSQIHNWLISNQNSTLDYVVNGSIEKGFEKSSCQQLNRGIILSDHGKIKVIPSLFIDEYDVEASHGAAIGQIDENQMFYLKSRGMNELEAKNLIISGYINPFLMKIKNDQIESLLKTRIKRLL